MQFVKESVQLVRDFDGEEVMKFLEQCGRTCYKSEDKITDGSAERFIRNIIRNGHESVLEHFVVTFRIICDRAIANEFTRHRLASYSQESTRYCDYSRREMQIVSPSDTSVADATQYRNIERYYIERRSVGQPPEKARAVLPLSLKTEFVMTANLREWRHILKLRTAKDAHPQMREVANMILDILREKLPVVFADIGGEKTVAEDKPRPVSFDGEKFVEDYDTREWLFKLGEEVAEVALAPTRKEMAGELADVITVCISWLESLGYSKTDRAELFQKTNAKNAKRGYFKRRSKE